MDICIIGTGYVGLVTGTCFADLGNNVICVDKDARKITQLRRLKMPIYEPGLEELVTRNVKEGRLIFTCDLGRGVRESEVVFIAVGTPPCENGEADLSYVECVALGIAKAMPSYRLVVEKSTVPVETGKWVKHTLSVNVRRGIKFDVASNPEFLREGSAIRDFMHPDRIVIGVETKRARDSLLRLYEPLGVPVVVTDIVSAELIKHASNSFLATKISYINMMSNVCEHVGADVLKVAEGMGLDRRIGGEFLSPGVGYGGFCLPKDVDAFIRIGEKLGCNFSLLKAVREINESQRRALVKKIMDALWIMRTKTIAILGLSFKPGTDDMRFAPSVDIINILKAEGARVRVFDPQAMEKAKRSLNGVTFCKDPYDAAKKSDALLVITEWNEFKELDFLKIKRLLRQPIIVDGRGIYDPGRMRRLGFKYIGIGRGN